MEYGWSKEIEGLGVSQESIEDHTKKIREEFSIDRNWLLSKDAVVEGLNWSIERIKKTPSTKPKLD